MCEQERYDYEVMRELHEDTTEAWDISFGTAEEARGDYDHDQEKQRELDEG